MLERETDVKEVTSSNETVINDKGNEAQGTETLEKDSTVHFDVVITLKDKETESEQLLRKANGERVDESKGKVINIMEEDQIKMMESRPTEIILLTPSEEKPIRQKSNKATEGNTNNLGITADDSLPLEESLNTSVDWETCDDDLSDSSDTSDEDELDDDVIEKRTNMDNVIEKRTNTEKDDESSDHEVILKESTIGTDSTDREVASVEEKDSIEEAGKIDNSEGCKESRIDESTGISVASAEYTSEWETFEEEKHDLNISDAEIVFRKESHETTNTDDCETNENKSSAEARSIHSDIIDDESKLDAVEIQNADQSSQWETFEEEEEDNHSPLAEDEEVVLKTKPNNPASLHEQDTEGIQGGVAEKAFSQDSEFQESAQPFDTETFEQGKEDNNDSLTEQKEMENNSGDKEQKNSIQAADITEKDKRCSGKQIQTDYGNVLNTTTDWETCDESDTSCDSTEDINEDIHEEKANNEDDDTEEGRNSENTSSDLMEKDRNTVMDRSSEWETCDESDTSFDSTDEIKEKKTASEDKADDEVVAEETDNTGNALKNHEDKEEQKSLNTSSDWETCESDTSYDSTDETNDKVGESEEAAIETEQPEITNTIQKNNDELESVNTSSDWETVNESYTSFGSTDEINDKAGESEEAAIGTEPYEKTNTIQRKNDEHSIVNTSSDWETVNESYTSIGSTDEINDKTTESEQVSIESEPPEITNTIQRNNDEHAIVNTSSDWETVNESDKSCNTTDNIHEKSTIDTDREKSIDETVLDLKKSQSLVKVAVIGKQGQKGQESTEHKCFHNESRRLIDDGDMEEEKDKFSKDKTDQTHNSEEKLDDSKNAKDTECTGMILLTAFKNDLSIEWECLRQAMLCLLSEEVSTKQLYHSPCFNLLLNVLLR